MSSARDHAAHVLLTHEASGAFVGEDLARRRATLGDARDRALLTELVQGVLRRRGTLDAILSRHARRKLASLHRAVHTALRVGIHQLVLLDRIPPHAAVDHAVSWTRTVAGDARARFVNAVLRSVDRGCLGPTAKDEDARRDVPREDGSRIRFRQPVFPMDAQDPAINLAPRHALPVWMVRRWAAAHGWARTLEMAQQSIARPRVVLRARQGAKALQAWMQAAGVTGRFAVGTKGAWIVESGDREALAAVDEGLAWVQDTTSQRVAPLLQPRAGQVLLDLCAAPGGKSVHLADRMGAGTLVAADVRPKKVAALASLQDALGAVRLETVTVEAKGPLPFEAGRFHGVLVDAPCSNTGVLRRRVEVRSRLQPADVEALAALQADLLTRAAPCVRSGGALVYSVCSVEPEETEGVVAAFRSGHPAWSREEGFFAFPDADQDGGFAVRLRAP